MGWYNIEMVETCNQLRLIIYGTGRRLKKYIDRFDIDSIVCFTDRDYEKYADGLYGKRVISPKDICQYDYDFVIVTTDIFFCEISTELVRSYSVPANRILHIDYLIGENKKKLEYEALLRIEMMMQKYDHASCADVFRDALGHYINVVKQRLNDRGLRYLESYEINGDIFEKGNIVANSGTLWMTENSRSKVTIYVVTHKDYAVLGDPMYQTFGVGDKHDEQIGLNPEYKHDSIEHMNHLINECTALYSIWKHDSDSDYIGLNHYRRFFESAINPGLPVQEWEASIILKNCDVIVPVANVYGNSIMEQLKEYICEDAYYAGVEALYEVFEHRSETERNVLNIFVKENVMYPYQMFIMRRELVDEYCSWLFPILFELIERVKIKDDWDAYSKRIMGFIAERLFTVWLMLTEYRIEELPVIKTDDLGPYGLS